MRVFTILAVAACLMLAGCEDHYRPLHVAGGDAARGRHLITQFQCSACHVIPGVAGASGEAGPSLAAFGKRSYIAGRIPNQPDRLIQWLRDPPAMKPGTLMPSMGVSAQDARDMAAYLYTLDE